MTTIYSDVGNCLIHNFNGIEFTIDDLIRHMNGMGQLYSKDTIKGYFHKFKKDGAIATIGKIENYSMGKNKHVYKIQNVKEIQTLLGTPTTTVTHSRRLRNHKLNAQNIVDFTMREKPAKIFVTDYLYTILSAYVSGIKTSLVLSGPDIERFVRNIKKVSHRFSKVDVVEAHRKRAEYMNYLLHAQQCLQSMPKFEVHNCLIEDFKSEEFYQFEDLDCNGTWITLFPLYYTRLRNQSSKDSSLIKGFIFTVCERGTKKYFHSERIKALVRSSLETKFNPGSLFESETRYPTRQFKGEWSYIHLTRMEPGIISEPGRLLNMFIFRYRQNQGGPSMSTTLVVYR